ncbi:tetratricopeptide repeat protein [Metasolibacillus sp.]|uniref:helix-turn-helix domain-containing protein n=1 Tax=Metasolibacillus sp. TaxID=2703680 RepID=UPI0025EDA4D3|nr:tetratricopeptide repeat protein [Metasolibacillus sp.]MCT6922629.1 helix-turn-helix transcriptional regulator [Metasolibacillus sp.]MCT6939032.1 helix-turn-helix transcriptional regulator [Metasolibacillus sp.]
MKQRISQKIKELRKKRGLTQKDLAEGICTQAMVSNFEKGEMIPSSLTLFAIAQRLGVDMNYFFDISNSTSTSIKATDAQQIIRKLVHQHDYQSAYFIVQNELLQEALLAPEYRQFLLWHKGICLWFLHKELDTAIQTLEHALQIDNERNVEQTAAIMNSIAVVYFEAKLYDQSLEYYEKCLPLLKEDTAISYIIKIRTYFGASRTYQHAKKFNEALYLSKQGIQLCIENETLHLLGNLLFQTGHCLISIEDTTNAAIYLDHAQTIFTLENKFDYLKIIENLKENYLN